MMPAAIASSPAYRCTNPGMSPVANSRCRRSSNSRIVRITRYDSSSCSLIRSPTPGGATADTVSPPSTEAPPWKLRLSRLPVGCLPHRRVDVDRARALDQAHGRGLVRALELALAVERDRPRLERDLLAEL